MRIDVDGILEKQNKSRYWLSIQIGCNYQSIMNLCNGKTKAITFDLLEKICICLNCTPTDILIITDN